MFSFFSGCKSKSLTLFRGFPIFVLLSFFEIIVGIICRALFPQFISTALEVVLTLTLVQFYALWTHQVLTYPSAKTMSQRVPLFATAFRATAIPLVTVKLLQRFLSFTGYIVVHRDIFSKSYSIPLKLFVVAGLGSLVFALISAQIVLARIQASLLPADEKTVIPIDNAIGSSRDGDSEVLGLKEAWVTIRRNAWKRLAVRYIQVYALVWFCTVPVLIFVYSVLCFILFPEWRK
jgi:hypothetical protein